MDEGSSRQASIEQILNNLVAQGGFSCAMIASRDGLLLATAGQAETELIAAVAAAMKDLAERSHRGLTEITTRDDLGNRIVSRYFKVGDDLLLLAIKMSAQCAYRQLTTQAIRQIKQVWIT